MILYYATYCKNPERFFLKKFLNTQLYEQTKQNALLTAICFYSIIIAASNLVLDFNTVYDILFYGVNFLGILCTNLKLSTK